MIDLIDSLVLPLDKRAAEAIITAWDDIAHVGILRLARNQCWREWHSPDASMYQRCQARLAWLALERAGIRHIDRDVRPLIDSITKGQAK